MRAGWALLLLAGCHFAVPSKGEDLASGGDLVFETGDMSKSDLAPDCRVMCPESCAPDGSCKHLVPTMPVASGDLYPATGFPPLVIIGKTVVIDTDAGTITGFTADTDFKFHAQAQAGGPTVGVFSIAGLTLDKTASLAVQGQNALAIASTGRVQIDGRVDAACRSGSGVFTSAGPGGFAPGKGPGVGAAGTSSTVGGGGAGSGNIGGNNSSGSGGGPNYLDKTPFVLIGGSGGGGGDAPVGPARPGGAGGGAIQLSVDGPIVVAGTVNVGGCGGLAGLSGADGTSAGGGGGAGGALFLEGASLTLTGGAVLAANGGGGGGMGAPGEDAHLGKAPAKGGGATGTGNGGAAGSCRGSPGQSYVGGGGACGRLFFRTESGNTSDPGATLSPDGTDLDPVMGSLVDYGVATFR